MFCVLTTKALDRHSFLMGAYNKGSIQVCIVCVYMTKALGSHRCFVCLQQRP